MKYVKLFEQFVNESSTLSSIGATPAQVTAIHNSKSVHLLRNDNQYEQIKSKAEAKKRLMNAGDGVAIVSFDEFGNASVITRRNSRVKGTDMYDIATYDVNGDRIYTNPQGLPATKVITQLGKAKAIYYTNAGAFDQSKRGRDLIKKQSDIKFEVENALKGIIEAAYSKIEKKFNAVVQDIKREATEAMMNDDYAKADQLLDIISPKANVYSAQRKHIEIKDFIDKPFRSWAYDAKTAMMDRAKVAINDNGEVSSLGYRDDFSIEDLDIAKYKRAARKELLNIYDEVFRKFDNVIKTHRS